MDAVILAGGKGTRLQGIVPDKPKVMAEVLDVPFVEWILQLLKDQRIFQVIFCTGYLGEQIQEYFGDGSQYSDGRKPFRIQYSHEMRPLGTAGALKNALPLMQFDCVLVLNGDTYCHFDVDILQSIHEANSAQATMWLVRSDDCSSSGYIELGESNIVTQFQERGEDCPGLINGGVYCVERRLIEKFPDTMPLSLERGVFPQLVGNGLYGVVGEGFFLDIGTPESYLRAGTVLEQNLRARTHFLESANITRQFLKIGFNSLLVAARTIANTIRSGGKVLLCGNGGSAADCQHLAGELVNRLSAEYDRLPLPAIALTTDTSVLSAIANDRGYEAIFSRQVRALGQKGDVLIGITTSGASPNVIRALIAARDRGMYTVALTGRRTDICENCADMVISVPSSNTQRIQETHLVIEHVLCDMVEHYLFGKGRRQ